MHGPVTAIVVSWNDAKDAVRCVEALRASDYSDLEFVVVDNGSLPEHARALEQCLDVSQLLRLPANTGYTGGFNVGIRRALADGARWVVLINSDAVVEQGTITALVDVAASRADAAFVGAIIVTDDAESRVITAGATLDDRLELHHHGAGHPPPPRDTLPWAVRIVSGCVMLVRAAAIEEIGLLDEDFFAYAEDIDWSLRAERAGFKIYIAPAARAFHPDPHVRDDASASVVYYMTRNRLLLARKHFPERRAAIWLRFARTAVSWTVRPRWRAKREQRDALVRALIDAARGRRGAWTEAVETRFGR